MQVAAWPCPAEDDAVCGRDAGTSWRAGSRTFLSREERESALSDEEGKTARDAYQKILRWAAVRERSTAYLRERLLKDDFPAAVVEEGPSARPARTGGGRSTLRRRPRPHEACGRAGASRCRTGDRGARHRPSHPRFLGRARAEGEGLRSGPRPAALRRRPPKAKRARGGRLPPPRIPRIFHRHRRYRLSHVVRGARAQPDVRFDGPFMTQTH